MLRRGPTAVTLTSEDVASFAEMMRRRHKLPADSSLENYDLHTIDPNDELKPLPGDKARIARTREERIGVGQRA